jgi:hypothetical protein
LSANAFATFWNSCCSSPSPVATVSNKEEKERRKEMDGREGKRREEIRKFQEISKKKRPKLTIDYSGDTSNVYIAWSHRGYDVPTSRKKDWRRGEGRRRCRECSSCSGRLMLLLVL